MRGAAGNSSQSLIFPMEVEMGALKGKLSRFLATYD